MAWFRNHYLCNRCGGDWADEWSCMCDDDCPHCGARHISPDDSEDLTKIVEQQGAIYVALRSPRSAEHHPDYQFLGVFANWAHATEYLASADVD